MHCLSSSQNSHTYQGPLEKFDVPHHRFDHINIDLVGPLPPSNGFTHLLLSTVFRGGQKPSPSRDYIHYLRSGFGFKLDCPFRCTNRYLIRQRTTIHFPTLDIHLPIIGHAGSPHNSIPSSIQRSRGTIPPTPKICSTSSPYHSQLGIRTSMGAPWNQNSAKRRPGMFICGVSLWSPPHRAWRFYTKFNQCQVKH